MKHLGKKSVGTPVGVCLVLILTGLGFVFPDSQAQDQAGEPVPAIAPRAIVPKLTSAAAIQIAKEFCAKVGAPQTVTPTAVYPAPNRYLGQADSYWLPRWRITFGNEAKVEIDDSNGAVVHYVNIRLMEQPTTADKPVGAPLSKATIVKIAENVLAAAGTLGPISSPVANFAFTALDGNTVPPTPIDPTWSIDYKRMYQGIPYHFDQGVRMSLQVDTGELEVFGARFLTPPPTSGSGNVTREQAIETATARIAKEGLTTAVLDSCTQMVVQPNSQWLAPGYSKTQPGVSRVAWVCTYKAPRTTAFAPYHYDVWIDTETGKIIGGEIVAPN